MLRRVTLAIMIGCLGCGPAAPSPAVQADAEAELERLRALGYVDFSPDVAGPGESGVTLHDERRSAPGYNLYTIQRAARAELIDADGVILQSWSEPAATFWERTVLLENGDVLVISEERHLQRLSWRGEIVWRHTLPAHHDVGRFSDGRLITLTHSLRSIPAVHPSVQVRDDAVTLFDPRNQELQSLSLYDLISASPEILPLKSVPPHSGNKIDLIHANSVRLMTDARLEARHPLYAPGNILVCLRNQDAIAVVDWKRKKLIWAWGRNELEWPHDATLLPTGNILIFDNGTRREWSRVIEIDPLSGRIVWEYRAPEPTDFFTRARGSAQRLANGNTLISESNDGHAFEVTPDGEIVWEYFVPQRNKAGHRATIIRFYRYENAFVDPLLARFGEVP